eukprot:3656529-Amphidinium_carterae.1
MPKQRLPLPYVMNMIIIVSTETKRRCITQHGSGESTSKIERMIESRKNTADSAATFAIHHAA